MALLQVIVDDEQLKQLKMLAVQTDTNVSEIIRSAVSAILLEQQ
jgi:predicted transcriptional regulator